MLEYVRELNHFYNANPALWEIDHSYDGFQWLDFKDVNNSIIAFARFAENRDDHAVCLFNYTPQVFTDYRLGVPQHRDYQEVFNSDAAHFGGSGQGNPNVLKSFDEPFGEAPCHVRVTVPPLAGIILKPL
jgi:1,4-alpha-glucan branching enzyme